MPRANVLPHTLSWPLAGRPGGRFEPRILPHSRLDATDPGRLRLREVTTLADLRELEPVWEKVLGESETCTPFLTHEWATTWWECFGAGHDLSVLVLEDDHGPAAIAPFVRAVRQAGPISYRTLELLGTGALRFLGMGLSDRSDLLLARRREECARSLLAWLSARRSEWEVVDLRFLPSGSTTARIFAAEAAAEALGHGVQRCADSPFLTLDGSFESYVAQRGRNFRRGLRRKQGKLEQRGRVAMGLGAFDLEPLVAFDQAVSVSRRSWKGGAGTALLLHHGVRGFFRQLLPRLCRRGRLYGALLTVDGETVAHDLGFCLGGKLWSYDTAFVDRFASGSPGNLLTARVLEWAYAQGMTEYDFLRGDEDYKLAWTTESRRELQLVLDSGTRRGRIARGLGFDAKWALKRQPALVKAHSLVAGALTRLRERARHPGA